MVVKAEESGCSVGVDRIQIENGSQRHRVVTPPHVYKGKKKGRGGEKGEEKRPTIDWALIGKLRIIENAQRGLLLAYHPWRCTPR